MNMEQFYPSSAEVPLDHLLSDGGLCSIFRSIGCIGDSLASGAFESYDNGEKEYHVLYDYSWPAHLGHMCGCTIHNFSKGSLTAKEYCESFAESKDFWNPKMTCEAYIMALGVNDILLQCQELGTPEDIDPENRENNKPTFAGYYGKIIQRYRALNPYSKFFLMTMPRDHRGEERNLRGDAHAALLHELAKVFPNTYVLDFRRYAPVYDEKFREQFYLGNHMNPSGYVLTAHMVASYIDYIIRHHMPEFREIDFIRGARAQRML